MQTQQSKFPYRLARLSESGIDVKKQWVVCYYVWSVDHQKLVRKRIQVKGDCVQKRRDLAKKIKLKREEKRVSQAEVARALNIDPAAYYRLEKRGEKLSIKQVSAIANILGLTLIDLLSDEPSTTKVDSTSSQEAVSNLKATIVDLQQRVAELQAHIKDKESTVKLQERFQEQVRNQVHTIIFEVGHALGFLHLPPVATDEASQQAEDDFYNKYFNYFAETRREKQVGAVLYYGDQKLTYAQVYHIFKQIKKINRLFYSLFLEACQTLYAGLPSTVFMDILMSSHNQTDNS